jgi:hypothetical protein
MANLVITTECNGICPFCFAQDYVQKPAQRMDGAMVERLSVFCAGESKMQLIGGEPTLHPEVVNFVDLLLRQQGAPMVFVVTNLMGPTPTIEKLIAIGRCGFLVNIHGSEFVKNPALRERFKSHLALFKARRRYLTLGVTLFSAEQNFEYLYSLLRQDKGQSVVEVRVSPSVPTAANQNFLSTGIGDKWLEIVKRVHQICPEIRVFNDCPVINGCMFTPDVYHQLASSVDRMCFLPCTGATCPFDILPDGSARFCLGTTDVTEACLPNVFAFPSVLAARQAIHARMHHWVRTRHFKRCAHEQCEFLSCHGICPAILNFQNPNPNPARPLVSLNAGSMPKPSTN